MFVVVLRVLLAARIVCCSSCCHCLCWSSCSCCSGCASVSVGSCCPCCSSLVFVSFFGFFAICFVFVFVFGLFCLLSWSALQQLFKLCLCCFDVAVLLGLLGGGVFHGLHVLLAVRAWLALLVLLGRMVPCARLIHVLFLLLASCFMTLLLFVSSVLLLGSPYNRSSCVDWLCIVRLAPIAFFWRLLLLLALPILVLMHCCWSSCRYGSVLVPFAVWCSACPVRYHRHQFPVCLACSCRPPCGSPCCCPRPALPFLFVILLVFVLACLFVQFLMLVLVCHAPLAVRVVLRRLGLDGVVSRLVALSMMLVLLLRLVPTIRFVFHVLSCSCWCCHPCGSGRVLVVARVSWHSLLFVFPLLCCVPLLWHPHTLFLMLPTRVLLVVAPIAY